jgi:2-C-methyl-D-erythritol 2,4-cyclodiphosphate synthase
VTVRVGHGYDVHAFCAGDHITLGGVRIPYERGLAAHSDGDVVIHALCDALLGAMALGDIGRHFPDTDRAYRGVDSRILLHQVVGLLGQQGAAVANVDATVIAQAPRLGSHIDAMRRNLSADLGLPVERVGLKATTTEGLGYIGRGEGIAVHAVALVRIGQ